MDKYFVARSAAAPRKWCIFSKTAKGTWKRHATYDNRGAAEQECDEWNWLDQEQDDRARQAMGW